MTVTKRVAAIYMLALVATFARKRRLTAGSDIREYLEANVSFYAAAILSIIYPWNWFGVEFGFGGDFQMWAFTNPVLVVLLGSAGFQLRREAAARDG